MRAKIENSVSDTSDYKNISVVLVVFIRIVSDALQFFNLLQFPRKSLRDQFERYRKMSAEEENVPTNVESGDAEAAVTTTASEKKPTAKGGKAKKTKEVKAKKPAAKAPKKKTSPSHPTYEEMIKDAITTLKERTGSSQYAIQKFIEEKQKSLPPTFRKLLLVNLKRLVASGKLVKVKASFKLPSAKSAAAPKPTASAPAKKKPAVSKPKGKVAVAPAKAKSAARGSKKPAATAVSKTKAVAAAKPKAKVTAKPKSKTIAAVSKTKAIAAKPKAKERPAKASRTSTRTSPGKRAAPAKKVAAATKKAPAKGVKAKTVKSPAKRASTRKVKK